MARLAGFHRQLGLAESLFPQPILRAERDEETFAQEIAQVGVVVPELAGEPHKVRCNSDVFLRSRNERASSVHLLVNREMHCQFIMASLVARSHSRTFSAAAILDA